jgi:hypothetical protein
MDCVDRFHHEIPLLLLLLLMILHRWSCAA